MVALTDTRVRKSKQQTFASSFDGRRKPQRKSNCEVKNMSIIYLFTYFFLLRAATCAICLRGATFVQAAPGRGARHHGRQISAILRAWEEGGEGRGGGVGVAAARKNCPTRRWRRETPDFICTLPFLPKAWFMPLRHRSLPVK